MKKGVGASLFVLVSTSLFVLVILDIRVISSRTLRELVLGNWGTAELLIKFDAFRKTSDENYVIESE